MATFIISSASPFPATSPCRRARLRLPRRGRTVPSAHHDSGFEGRLVDENMIVLRRRIHEMEMAEANCETPSDWMGWEKRYYHASYGSDVCHALGLLQTLLMNARPSLAIGMVALVLLSVPTSAIFILYHLMEASRSHLIS